MNITKLLLQLDPTLKRFNEGHWQEDYIDVAGPGTVGFSSFNDAGLECETGEFMYGLVRVLKPYHVLETGTHWGIGASYMGLALKENMHGHLDTIEFLPEIHRRAVERIETVGLNQVVTCHFGDARAFEPGDKQYGLILLDTEPQTRFEELLRYYPYLMPGGFLFIHDLHRHMHQIPHEEHGFAWPFGPIPEAMRALVIDGKLRPMHFPTPRGLTGFYKPSSEDFVW